MAQDVDGFFAVVRAQGQVTFPHVPEKAYQTFQEKNTINKSGEKKEKNTVETYLLGSANPKSCPLCTAPELAFENLPGVSK